jgi:ribosomal protein S20
MRTALKQARAAIGGKDPEAPKLVRAAISFIDRAVSKGAVKRRTASRYISRLTRTAD